MPWPSCKVTAHQTRRCILNGPFWTVLKLNHQPVCFICCSLIACFSILVSTWMAHNARRCRSCGWSAHNQCGYIVSLQWRPRGVCPPGGLLQLWPVVYATMCTSHFIVIFVLHCIQWFCTIALYVHLVFKSVCSVLVSIYLYWCTSLYPDVSLWNKGNKDFVFVFGELNNINIFVKCFNYSIKRSACVPTLPKSSLRRSSQQDI